MSVLALSLGDPAGVGPEIIVKAWAALRHTGPAFMVIGDAAALAAVPWDEEISIRAVSDAREAAEVFADALPVFDIPLGAPVQPGKPSAGAAGAVTAWIEAGVDMALTGSVSGLVTAPIAKATLYEGGFQFPGHTEFLGALTADAPMDGARGPIMMLAAGDLRAALVTVHEPIAKVPALLTTDLIVHAGLVTAQALQRDFGISAPRLAVTGLNPHAGEGGALGREEIEIVAPAVAILAERGVDVRGPLPADSLFHADARRTYDAALCLYHDQALIPVKMLDFWGGVNLTLGLPIVRTSPDHGTGFDIAGQGIARADSLIAALRMAAAIAVRRAAGR